MPAQAQAQGIRLPTAEQTLLLRACLLGGAAGREAWAEWRGVTADPIDTIRRDNSGLRRLLPLLFAAAKRDRLAIDGLLRTALRTAYVREQWRMRTLGELLVRAWDALSTAGIDAIILNGAALAYSVYNDPGTRHCHDIDFLTDEDGIARARRALLPLAFRPVIQDSQRARFEHSSDLPLELYTRLRYQLRQNSSFSLSYEEAGEVAIENRILRTLSPLASLLQVCSRPATEEKSLPLGVFCDAWLLIQRHSNLSWPDLADRACQFGVERRCRAVLTYLRDVLDAGIPQWPAADSADAGNGKSGSLEAPFSVRRQ